MSDTDDAGDPHLSKGDFKEGDKVVTYGEIRQWDEDYKYWVVDFGGIMSAPDDYKYCTIVSSENLIKDNDRAVLRAAWDWQPIETCTKEAVGEADTVLLYGPFQDDDDYVGHNVHPSSVAYVLNGNAKKGGFTHWRFLPPEPRRESK